MKGEPLDPVAAAPLDVPVPVLVPVAATGAGHGTGPLVPGGGVGDGPDPVVAVPVVAPPPVAVPLMHPAEPATQEVYVASVGPTNMSTEGWLL